MSDKNISDKIQLVIDNFKSGKISDEELVSKLLDIKDLIVAKKTIVIEVEGGVVIDVRNLPDEYDYEIIDRDENKNPF